jgi:hypothetical protein
MDWTTYSNPVKKMIDKSVKEVFETSKKVKPIFW